METYPYPSSDGIIYLVRKTEFDRLKWELEEQRAELAKWQTLAGQLAEVFKVFIEQYEDRKCQFGSDYLWQKHEDVDAINRANQALAAYESATATTGKPETAQ